MSTTVAEATSFFTTYKDEWVHVTGVFSPGQSVALYVNGEKVAEETTSIPTEVSLTDLFKIGARADASSGFWDGQIDEVRVVARALSQAEIQDLMDPDEVYSQTEQTVSTKYYFAGGRLAMRTNGTLNYLLSDHLGSTSVTADANGDFVSEMRYMPWGETRYMSGTVGTDYLYTGQRRDAYFKLVQMGARWYDPALGRFIQPDSIVPEKENPQALDRYAYVSNNPINYIDPSGHCWGILSWVRGIYKTTCNNMDMALTIIKSEEASLWNKTVASAYVVGETVAHGTAVVYSGIVVCGAASAACYEAATAGTGATTAICADGECDNEVRTAYQIGKEGTDLVFRMLNDPSLQEEVRVYVNEAGRRFNYFARLDGLTNSAIHEVKNFANLPLSKRFMDQTYRYKLIADSMGLDLHYWLVRSAPDRVIEWLEDLGIVVHAIVPDIVK